MKSRNLFLGLIVLAILYAVGRLMNRIMNPPLNPDRLPFAVRSTNDDAKYAAWCDYLIQACGFTDEMAEAYLATNLWHLHELPPSP